MERLDEAMPKIETLLELTQDQSGQMRSALLAQYDPEAELTRRWEAGEGPEILGEIKRDEGAASRGEACQPALPGRPPDRAR